MQKTTADARATAAVDSKRTWLERQFLDYRSYHTDKRNEATHAVGIPMIVLAILMWTSRVHVASAGGVDVDLAMILVAAASCFYIAVNLPLGLAMAALLSIFGVGARMFSSNEWLALALFVAGWALQFVGHAFEGKRPAFFKNASHLLVGPAWILSRLLGGFPFRRDYRRS